MGLASSAQSQMQQQHNPTDGFPWWVRFVAKGLGIGGGFVAMFFAVVGFVTTDAHCIVAVTLQLVIGFLTIALEAPFCCMFVDFIEKIANFSESRAYWQKALIYCLMGLIPIVICPELATILGAGMIFLCGCAYGFMALGKKADRSTMMASASGTGGHDASAWDSTVNQQTVPPAYGLP